MASASCKTPRNPPPQGLEKAPSLSCVGRLSVLIKQSAHRQPAPLFQLVCKQQHLLSYTFLISGGEKAISMHGVSWEEIEF